MARQGCRALRERFDDAPHPAPQGRPTTHRCDLYLATDAAMIGTNAGFGAVIETPDGTVRGRFRRHDTATDNNDAEVRALHFGLDRLDRLSASPDRVGLLVDHEPLAKALARCVSSHSPTPTRPPTRTASPHHWGGITARLAGLSHVRVALVDGQANPAHGLANGVATQAD